MKQVLKFTACICSIAVVTFISCKKELSCFDCVTNTPPIANAGSDQTITLPKDSVLLDGSACTDPDGNITSYKWSKVAGPASYKFLKPDSSKTLVKGLVFGIYRFELTVTDNSGLLAKDTVQVIVNNSAINQSPVACAGPDQIITLPNNSVNLDGDCTTDPDNNIADYSWKQVSDSSANIANAMTSKTFVSGLSQGVYQFELKVTDVMGLSSSDTVQITVNAAAYICGDTARPQFNTQLIRIGTLSEVRNGIAVASAGNKLLFAGGFSDAGNSSRVDIYDLITKTWSTAKLSEARYDIAAAATGDKILFAGGEVSDGTCATKTVDIYDATTNKWTTSSLSIPGNSIAAATVGNKVLFGGGDAGFCGAFARSSRVDIYDVQSGSWSIASFSSIRRGGQAAVTLNNKVYFSGGESWPANPVPGSWYISNTVDIYDNATGSWSTSFLSEGKLGHSGVAADNRIFWAGGETGAYPTITSSCSVEVMNEKTGTSSSQTLSKPGRRKGVVRNNQVIFFAGDNTFDVYDVMTDKWSIGVIPAGFYGTAIISVNNTLYVTDGKNVYILEF